MRAEGTPVPIPNTTVKIRAADGTMLETAWESRRLPGIFNITKIRRQAGGSFYMPAWKNGRTFDGKNDTNKKAARA